MYQGKLNARASKSSGWSENVKLMKFATRLDISNIQLKEIFVGRICSGTQKKHSVMISKSLFFFGSERCPGAECLFHQRSLGGHKMDNRPTDSNGNLCGEGENAGKPYSHYFDLTLCAKLNSTSQPCSSVQVYMLSIPLLT